MRDWSSTKFRLLASASAGLALVACSEPTSTDSAQQAAPPASRIATANPQTDGYIVTLERGGRFAGARIGGRLSDVIGVSGASVNSASVTAKVPSINGLVVRGVANPDDIRLGGGVVSVIPNYVHDLEPSSQVTAEAPGDAVAPTGTNQSSAFFFANNTQWGYKRVQANRAWVPSKGAQGVKVCIVDSGIDDGHSAFVPNGAYPAGKVIMKTSFVEPGVGIDSNFHGTHVAGTISTNGFGWASVATNASLMTAKVFNAGGGGATSAVIFNAIAWCADNGADVMNMSLGFTGGIPRAGNAAFIAAYQTALDYATNQGVLIVASAGNDGAAIPQVSNIWLPAEANGVVSVAALGPVPTNPGAFGANPTWTNPGSQFDGIAGYSNRGSAPLGVDVSAPGGDRPAGWPVQSLIMSPCSRFSPYGCGATSGIYSAGTSMAAPHVSGVAALIRGRYMTTPRSLALRNKIESCLYKTVDNIGSTTTFGRGRVNAYKATTTPC